MQEYVDDKIIKDIYSHAEDEYPKESCGIVIKSQGLLKYIRCNNISETPREDFTLDPRDYMNAESAGNIEYIVHSHPDASSNPSSADKIQCNLSQIPWIIISYPNSSIYTMYPGNSDIPYEGREFIFGVLDCFTLIRDYYNKELNINIKDYERRDNFWKRGENLYLDNFEKEGFISIKDIDKPQKHDVFLLNIGSNISNHGAIYLDNDIILHHLYGRLSEKTVYGGYWRKHTTYLLRHKSLC